MAFSNSFDYTHTVTAANIIALALRRLGVYDPDETINSTEESNALLVLNLLVKEWSQEGYAPYLIDTMYLMLSTRTNSLTFPGPERNLYNSNSSINYLLFGYNVTTLASAAASSASTITVLDDDAIETSDIILIKMTDGQLYATTVNGAPAANVVTLTNSMPGAAAAGAKVYTTTSTNRYQSSLIRVLSANVIETMATDLTLDHAQSLVGERVVHPMNILGDNEFFNLSLRSQIGTPINLYHKKVHDSSELYIWPNGPLDDIDMIEINAVRPIQDLDATSDNLSITPMGLNALAWGLAAELAPEYGLSENEIRRLYATAEQKKANFFDTEVENASVIFSFNQE